MSAKEIGLLTFIDARIAEHNKYIDEHPRATKYNERNELAIKELLALREQVIIAIGRVRLDIRRQTQMFGTTEDTLFKYGYEVRMAACTAMLELLGASKAEK